MHTLSNKKLNRNNYVHTYLKKKQVCSILIWSLAAKYISYKYLQTIKRFFELCWLTYAILSDNTKCFLVSYNTLKSTHNRELLQTISFRMHAVKSRMTSEKIDIIFLCGRGMVVKFVKQEMSKYSFWRTTGRKLDIKFWKIGSYSLILRYQH